MKKLNFFVLAVIGMLCSLNVSAYPFEVEGMHYEILSEADKTVEVVEDPYAFVNDDHKYSGDIIIPEKIEYVGVTYSVSSIGNSAFYNCSGLTSVEIPNSVTSIGEWAFTGCENLKMVFNRSDLSFYKGSESCGCVAYYADKVVNNYDGKLGDFHFANNNGTYSMDAYTGNDTELVLPEKYKENNYAIGSSVFTNCSGLTSVEIPNSVTSIGNSAFYNCSGLTSVVIPNSVTSIGERAFQGCSGLTSVVIPNSVTSISDRTFSGCSGLTSVDIPNSVTDIGYCAFSNCYGLTSVEIPNSVTSIGNYAFEGCYGLTTEIPNSVTSIGDGAFLFCFGLTALEIPNSVTSLGDFAFYSCSNLTSVEIGNNVTSIGNSAFSGCSNLTSVVIPNSVTSIGDYVFSSCRRLTSVVIPNSVTGIGDYAFQSCSSLTSVTSYIPANKLFPISSVTFNYVDTDQCTLYVPKGAKETYATMEGWNVFENIVEIHPGYELTVTDAGYSTLYLDFTAEIPEGVEVYTAKEVDDVWLQMEQVEEVLPANTGVLVKAPAGTYKFAYSNTTAPSIENNLFKGSETDKYINVPSNSSAFVLSMVDGEVGMYLAKLTDGSFLNNANKAYLLIDNNKLGLSDDELDTSVDGAQLSLRFNFGGATDIDKVNTESYNAPVIYDMYGRKVQQIMRPGLYIINGKKVMMK